MLGTAISALGQRFDSLAAKVTSWLTGWKLIVLPVAVLAAARVALLSHFPSTHGLTDDWYNHANYLTLFVLGAMLARSSGVWQRMDALRWNALGLAFASWASLIIFFSLPEQELLKPEVHHWRMMMRVVWVLCAWSAIVAVCGFAHRHLNRDSASRHYLTEAVFPVYILHQTLIVSLAHLIKPAKIAPACEGLVLVVLTLCISFGAFELIRRLAVLRPLFGLRWSGPASAKDIAKRQMPATANC